MIRPDSPGSAPFVDDALLLDLAHALEGYAHRVLTRGGVPADPAEVAPFRAAAEVLRRGSMGLGVRNLTALRPLVGRGPGRLVTLAELDDGRVSVRTARRWAESGRITARKVGRTWLVLLEDVEQLIRERERR